ncbi:MAG TPA: hypothetical protein VFE65_15960 [Pseudonocardia sp.]|jgi:hypothetical protein|nr:hypothetical protein [Pseudonocardia sp.]
MRTFAAALALGGTLSALPILFAGVATAAAAPTPAPPKTPTYICDNVFAVQPSVYGYTNCQAFGGVPKSAYFTRGQSYLLIPRTGGGSDDEAANAGKIQKYRCWGGNVDLPTAVAPERCTEVGPAVPAAQAPPPVPFSG